MLTTIALAVLAFVSPQDTPTVVADELGAARNVHRAGELFFSGQFEQADIAVLKERGITRVITLRQDGEVAWDEKGLVEAEGIEFVSLPFRGPDALTDELMASLRGELAKDVPTLLHCGSANRVGGAWIPFRVLDQKVPLEQALTEAVTIGLTADGYRDRAVAYVEAVELERQSTVPDGINKNFLDPELDVDSYLERFETESREVYSARFEILKALAIQPGEHVADIGAGTGLYTHLFTPVAGWVYAVDISPRFLEYIHVVAATKAAQNLTTVLCPANSVGLPPASVDVAFICDTYHHFEQPVATMKSLHRALRDGGRVLVLDFERIPGVTRPWLLEHVRAGKDVFQREIEQAGFVLSRELEVPGIEENYVLEFRKAK